MTKERIKQNENENEPLVVGFMDDERWFADVSGTQWCEFSRSDRTKAVWDEKKYRKMTMYL